MPSLVVTSGTLTGQVFSFSDSAVIGRGQFSEVRLNDPTVSRRHALIRSVGTGYELTDQESANGTRYRGVRIAEPVLIHDGDELEFGEIKTVFHSAVTANDEASEAPARSETATASQATMASHSADAVQLRASPPAGPPAPSVAEDVPWPEIPLEPSADVPAPRPVRPAAAASRPARVAAPAAAPASEDTSAVSAAMRALRVEHNPVRARALLARYLGDHPNGALAEEALALSIEAALAHHDGDVAALANRYLRRYPRGSFQELARQALVAQQSSTQLE